jgi:SAM-dependent methyltransferase
MTLAARVYDLVEGDAPHFDDLAWYRTRLEGIRGPVLELAAGTGRLTRGLGEAYPHVVLDLDRNMLGVLRRRSERPLGIVCGDLSRLPFRSAGPIAPHGFDACLCAYNSLGCLLDRRDVRRAFREMRRVTASGGLCLFDVGEVRMNELPPGEKLFEREHWALPDGGALTRRVRVRSLPDTERVELEFEYREVRGGRVIREEHGHSALNTFPLDDYVRAAEEAGFELTALDEHLTPSATPIRLWAFVALRSPTS